MTQPARSAIRLRPLRQWGSVALRLVLLISAWQAPFPWIHCHRSLPAASAAADDTQPWLARHLQSHHALTPASADVDFGWHVHIDLPTPKSDDDKNESPRPYLVRGIAAETVASLCSESRLVAHGEPLAPKMPGMSLPEVAAAGIRQHFFDSFAESLAVPLRFCVARN